MLFTGVKCLIGRYATMWHSVNSTWWQSRPSCVFNIPALLCGSRLNSLDFLLFSFSSCSCEISFCNLRFGLPDATLNFIRAMFLKSKIAPLFNGLILQKSKTLDARSNSLRVGNFVTEKVGKCYPSNITFPGGELGHECVSLKASKYCISFGLVLDNLSSPWFSFLFFPFYFLKLSICLIRITVYVATILVVN